MKLVFLYLLGSFLKHIDSLELRSTHSMGIIETHDFAYHFWDLAHSIGLVVILVVIGGAVWFLRGCCTSDTNNSN